MQQQTLPRFKPAATNQDLEALNLLARHYLVLHAKDKKSPYLEKAWETTLNILALDGPREEKEQGLQRAVDLAPRIRAELGQAWLDQSYTKHIERGMSILATLGTVVSQGLQTNPHNAEQRKRHRNGENGLERAFGHGLADFAQAAKQRHAAQQPGNACQNKNDDQAQKCANADKPQRCQPVADP